MSFINIIQTTSILGMTFCGYHFYPQIKNFINKDVFRPIKYSLLDFQGNRFITEDNFCKIIGSLTGTMIGRLFYPIGIPYTLYFVDKYYGDVIIKFLKG